MQLGSKKRLGVMPQLKEKPIALLLSLACLVNWQILLWLVTGNEGKAKEATVIIQGNAQGCSSRVEGLRNPQGDP